MISFVYLWLWQVEALLDRTNGEAPVMDFVARSLEELGYASWAQRIVHSGGAHHLHYQ